MTREEFRELTQRGIVYLDGATGTNLQKAGMPAGVCPELWILEHPDVLVRLQESFIEAGSNIVYAPSFGGNRIKLREYGLEDRLREINTSLLKLSKEAAAGRAYVAGDITMTGRQLHPIGDMQFEELVDIYKEQILALCEAGADLLVVETMMSLQETRAAIIAAREVCELPVMATLTFESDGRTLFGTLPECVPVTLQGLGADAVGLNCSTGPEQMEDLVRAFYRYSSLPVIAKPNAGMPELEGDKSVYRMTEKDFAEGVRKLVRAGARIVGGCCGTTPGHIKAMREMLENESPLPVRAEVLRALSSERRVVEIKPGNAFQVIGERINPTGKKALQKELREGKLNLVRRMAREQEKAGAAILDVNCGTSGIDEKETMLRAIDEISMVTDLPLCIDSSYPDILETALRLYPGRALINSVSCESAKSDRLMEAAKKYGAMFILLPVSDEGIPDNIETKHRLILEAVEKAESYGLRKEDIIVDALTAAVGADPAAALSCLETISFCRERGLATVCGLSNISFGLPQRAFVNGAFLVMAISRGLTMAIANPMQDMLMNLASASDLLLNREGADLSYIRRMQAYTRRLEEEEAARAALQASGVQGTGVTGQTSGVQCTGGTGQVSGTQCSGGTGQVSGTQCTGGTGQVSGTQGSGGTGQVSGTQCAGAAGQVSGTQGSGAAGQTSGPQPGAEAGQSAADPHKKAGDSGEGTLNGKMAGTASDMPAGSSHPVYKAVLDGETDSILELVREELAKGAEASGIIDHFLIPAINQVGVFFDRKEYFLPQLIASANAMKAAIAYLEPMLARGDDSEKADPVVIATVEGDVHDIGKNLVALMLQNYGYRVIDLGKNVAAEDIVRTALTEKAPLIALSALMTTTMMNMKHVIAEAGRQGYEGKIIVGGAAVTEQFAKEIGADGYSTDAADCVRLVNELLGKESR